MFESVRAQEIMDVYVRPGVYCLMLLDAALEKTSG